jgi:hypothetical protein
MPIAARCMTVHCYGFVTMGGYDEVSLEAPRQGGLALAQKEELSDAAIQ